MSEEKIDAYTVYASTDYVDEKIANVNSVKDWNINDENDPAYIKNRTHWVEAGLIEVLPETTVYIDDNYIEIYKDITLEVGKTYNVVFNGTEYECIAWSNSYNAILIGNGSICGGNNVSTGNIGGNNEPFSCENYEK